jgi:hypothetical protein
MKRSIAWMTAMSIAAAAIAAGSMGAAGAQERAETTIGDQTDVAVTVYNNNLALVRDRRKMNLGTGEAALVFSDVAELIRPETVSIRSVSNPGSIRIVEQNYEYDLMSPEKLMEKYIGKTVKLQNFSKDVDLTTVEAVLLSLNNGPVYRVGDEIYLGYPGNVVLPEVPENLIAKPSLIWLLDNDQGSQELEATYLTGGLSWKADYVVRMSKDEKKADIDAWVTLDNQSGAAYTNAQLKLVAGDVNIVPQEMPMAKFERAMAASPAPMIEESFAEYHLYTLPRRTTIKQAQSKQVSLFNAAGIGVTKKYEFRGQGYYFYQRIPQMESEKVGVFIEFKNEEANQLGMPLPGGVMRLYQEDSDSMLQFAGEDRIQHTPKNEKVTLRMGNAFDVVGERVQTNYRVVSGNVHESEYKITLRNHKETDIVVDVVEPMMAEWRILQSSIPHEKRDAQTAVFRVPVKADGEVVLTYGVQVRTQ